MSDIEYTGYTKEYACPLCGTNHTTKSEARRCCTDDIETCYVCDECGEEFDNAKMAKECCPEYICSECLTGHTTRDGADTCCKVSDETPEFYPVYPEVRCLNAAGSLPTFPAHCPKCGAEVKTPGDGRHKAGQGNDYFRTGPKYACGGRYMWKSQIQNHHNVWWGSCGKD